MEFRVCLNARDDHYVDLNVPMPVLRELAQRHISMASYLDWFEATGQYSGHVSEGATHGYVRAAYHRSELAAYVV